MRFHSDLDALGSVVGRLEAAHAELDVLSDLLHSRMAELHEAWDGASASEHMSAQADWDAGFATMRTGLADLRSAVGTALTNYSGAAEANRTMWHQLG